MKLGEAVASARRVGPVKAIDGSLAPVIDFSTVGSVQKTINDGDWLDVDASVAGVIVPILDTLGDPSGLVYYQAPAPDATTQGFLGLKLAIVCLERAFREEVEVAPQGIPVGSVDATLLHIGPLEAKDVNGNPVLGGVGIIVEISINGAQLQVPINDLVELANGSTDGFYDLPLDPSELPASRGWVIARIYGACQEFVMRVDVVDESGGGGSGDINPPTITIISPTPGVAPGEPGGFPRRYRQARETPIVLDVTDVDPGLQFFVIIARFYADAEDPNPTEEVVHRRGQFRGAYVRGSSAEVIEGGTRLNVLRAGGWPSSRTGALSHIVFAIDALDADGNLA